MSEPPTGAGLRATLVTAAAAAAAAGGICFLVLRALDRQQTQRGSRVSGDHSARVSTAASQRCWQWLDEADERARPDNAGSAAAGAGSTRSHSHSHSHSRLDTNSADNSSRVSVPELWGRKAAATVADGLGGGWGAILAGVQPPSLPPNLHSSGSSARSGGSSNLRSGGSSSQAALADATQRTAAEALTGDSVTKPTSQLRPSPGSPPEDGTSSGGSGTAQLEELQLCKNRDGSPQLLGRGGFGQVYKALYQSEMVAVKVFPLEAHAKGEANFRKEIALLRSCQHENIVGFKAACLDAPNHLLMVMELAEGGDLREALDDDKASELRWYKRERGPNGEPQPGLGKAIALGISRGLEFLHARHIVHLDLKSPNVLLTSARVAKVADVGLARLMPADYLSCAAAVGTFSWTAPEVLLGAKCSAKVDIFSLGVILWELVTGEAPRRGRMRALRVPEECSAGVADLVSACMEHRAARRPQIAEVVRLLSGDAALLDERRAPPFDIDPPDDEEQADSVAQSDLLRLREFYNSWSAAVFGSLEAAFAEGYTEEALETVVQSVRPAEGHTYMAMLGQLEGLLQSPDIEDPASPARGRCLELMRDLISLYVLKIRLSSLMAVQLRQLDLDSLAKEEVGSATSGTRKHGIAAAATSNKEQPQLELWRPTLRALGLSPPQTDALAEARRQLGVRFGELRGRRGDLVAKLQRLSESGNMEGSLHASTELRANIQAEAVALTRFQAWFWQELLSPLQLARGMVASKPILLDPDQLGALLLSDRRRPLESHAL